MWALFPRGVAGAGGRRFWEAFMLLSGLAAHLRVGHVRSLCLKWLALRAKVFYNPLLLPRKMGLSAGSF